MNKLHRSRYINVVVSMMMAFLMLAAMGTTQVHAAQYTTGTIDPAELKAGDVVNISPEVKHWHGAARDSWFQHLAVEVPAEGASNEWLEFLPEEEYDKLP